jgi:hypothetical protein
MFSQFEIMKFNVEIFRYVIFGGAFSKPYQLIVFFL